MNKTLNTDSAILLKRLHFRSHHRGWKETDLVMGNFADRELAALTPEELLAYEALLEESDADIWDWLVEKLPVPKPEYAPLMARLRKYSPAL